MVSNHKKLKQYLTTTTCNGFFPIISMDIGYIFTFTDKAHKILRDPRAPNIPMGITHDIFTGLLCPLSWQSSQGFGNI